MVKKHMTIEEQYTAMSEILLTTAYKNQGEMCDAMLIGAMEVAKQAIIAGNTIEFMGECNG